MDAVKSTKKEEKTFTVVAVDQVVWARVRETSLTVRIIQEPTPITIDQDDELFTYYCDMFKGMKSKMVTKIETVV